jgi:hypothetical protein
MCVVFTGLFASKPAPTFEMHSHVGAGLLAKEALKALQNLSPARQLDSPAVAGALWLMDLH